MSKHILTRYIVRDMYGAEIVRTFSKKKAKRYACAYILHCLNHDEPFVPVLRVEYWSLSCGRDEVLEETEVIK